MLTLTEPQIAVFQRAAEDAFVRRLLSHLAAHHAEALAQHPETARERRVEVGIARARSHGLTWESSITAFVAIMFEVGPGFDQHPIIREMLADEGIPAMYKMRAIAHNVSNADWEAAARLSEERGWDDAATEGA